MGKLLLIYTTLKSVIFDLVEPIKLTYFCSITRPVHKYSNITIV